MLLASRLQEAGEQSQAGVMHLDKYIVQLTSAQTWAWQELEPSNVYGPCVCTRYITQFIGATCRFQPAAASRSSSFIYYIAAAILTLALINLLFAGLKAALQSNRTLL